MTNTAKRRRSVPDIVDFAELPPASRKMAREHVTVHLLAGGDIRHREPERPAPARHHPPSASLGWLSTLLLAALLASSSSLPTFEPQPPLRTPPIQGGVSAAAPHRRRGGNLPQMRVRARNPTAAVEVPYPGGHPLDRHNVRERESTPAARANAVERRNKADDGLSGENDGGRLSEEERRPAVALRDFSPAGGGGGPAGGGGGAWTGSGS